MQYQEILDALPEAVCILNQHGKLVYSNRTFEALIAPYERVRNLQFVEEFVNQDDTDKFNQGIQDVFEGVATSVELSSCQTLCFGVNDFPLYRSIDWLLSQATGKSTAETLIIATGRLSENSNKEEEKLAALRDAESEMTDFFQNAPIAMHWLNAKGVVIWTNAAHSALLGYSMEEFVGKHVSEFCHPEDTEVAQALMRQLTNGEVVRSQTLRFRTKDGRIRYLLVDANANYDTIELHDDGGSQRDTKQRTNSRDGKGSLSTNGGGGGGGVSTPGGGSGSSRSIVGTGMGEDTVLKLRHVRCFLRDDTDRLIMEAIATHEKHELEAAAAEKVAFLQAIVREITDMLAAMKQVLPQDSLPAGNGAIVAAPGESAVEDPQAKAAALERQLDVLMHSYKQGVMYNEIYMSNIACLMSKVDFAMHFENSSVRTLEPQEIMLLRSINEVIVSSRDNWSRDGQLSKLSYVVSISQSESSNASSNTGSEAQTRTTSIADGHAPAVSNVLFPFAQQIPIRSTSEAVNPPAGMSGAGVAFSDRDSTVRSHHHDSKGSNGNGYPPKGTGDSQETASRSNSGTRPPRIFASMDNAEIGSVIADYGLIMALQYLLNLATVFSPDDGTISLDIKYSRILKANPANLRSATNIARGYANDPNYFPEEDDGDEYFESREHYEEEMLRRSQRHQVQPHQQQPQLIDVSSCDFTFCISFQCCVPMDALSIYKSLKNFSCPLDLYVRHYDDEGYECSFTLDPALCRSPEQLQVFLSSMDIRLGIYVAANMITLMEGGPLKFSVTNERSCFWFSVPLKRLNGAYASSASKLQRPQDASAFNAAGIYHSLSGTMRDDEDEEADANAGVGDITLPGGATPLIRGAEKGRKASTGSSVSNIEWVVDGNLVVDGNFGRHHQPVGPGSSNEAEESSGVGNNDLSRGSGDAKGNGFLTNSGSRRKGGRGNSPRDSGQKAVNVEDRATAEQQQQQSESSLGHKTRGKGALSPGYAPSSDDCASSSDSDSGCGMSSNKQGFGNPIKENSRHHFQSSSSRAQKARYHLNSRSHSTGSASSPSPVPQTSARATSSSCSSGSGEGGGTGTVKWRPMQESAVVSHLRMNTDVNSAAVVNSMRSASVHSTGSSSSDGMVAAVTVALAAAADRGTAVTMPSPSEPQELTKPQRQQQGQQRSQQKQQQVGNYLSAENISAAMEQLTTSQSPAQQRAANPRVEQPQTSQQRNQLSSSVSEANSRRVSTSSKGTNSGNATPHGSQQQHTSTSSFFPPPGPAEQLSNRTVRQTSPALSHRPTASPPIGTFPQRRPMRILVVDDSLICQKVLAQALSKMGYLTDVADNGRAALDKLVHVPCLFDAVVMDVIMPIMDGYTATRVCRQELHLTIPILILSADVLPDTRQCMLSVGASAFVIKPVKLMELVEILHSFNVQTPGSVAYLEGMHRQRMEAQLKDEQRFQAQLQKQQQKLQASDSDSNGGQEREQQPTGRGTD